MVMTKEETGRIYIAQFLAAMTYHDPDLQNTIKFMRNRLLEIQQRESVLIKKPIRKIVIKCRGSEPVVLRKRTHSETLAAVNNTNDAVEKDCKRQKMMMIKKTNGCTQSTKVCDQKTKESLNVLDFIKSVGGLEAELVIEKRLTVSDVSGNLGRLLIPVLQVKNPGFLTGEEKTILGEKQNVSVFVFDPERRKVALNLGKWKMSKEYYVLKTK